MFIWKEWTKGSDEEDYWSDVGGDKRKSRPIRRGWDGIVELLEERIFSFEECKRLPIDRRGGKINLDRGQEAENVLALEWRFICSGWM